ncbi:MAG: DUF3313 family protein [Steroidobacteraceae bacterium]
MNIQIPALLAIFLATSATAADTLSNTDDGLVLIKVKNVDRAYQRPGASLKGYTGVVIRPVTVAFSKNWKPRDYGAFGMKSEEVERIRSDLAKTASDTFARVLSKRGYTIAAAPGPNVLEVQMEIVDLYVNGPDSDGSFNRTYVRSAGEMRLLVTLRDSVTGSTLYRTSDFERGDETGPLQWATRVFNRVEAERTFAGWALQLVKALDAAKQN